MILQKRQAVFSRENGIFYNLQGKTYSTEGQSSEWAECGTVCGRAFPILIVCLLLLLFEAHHLTPTHRDEETLNKIHN